MKFILYIFNLLLCLSAWASIDVYGDKSSTTVKQTVLSSITAKELDIEVGANTDLKGSLIVFDGEYQYNPWSYGVNGEITPSPGAAKNTKIKVFYPQNVKTLNKEIK